MSASQVKNIHKKADIFQIIMFVWLVLLAASFLFMILWGFFTSLKSVEEFLFNIIGLPKKPTFANYPFVYKHYYVLTADPVTNFPYRAYVPELFFNTVIYVFGCGLAATALPFLMAYANVKFTYKFNKIIYAFVIAAMIVPIVGAAPSEMRMARLLGLYNTRFGLPIMRSHFLGMYFLIMCAAFKGIPKELSEAAYVDGASEFRVMLQIVMPMALNVFGVVLLLKCIEFWNEYTAALLYQPSYPTLAVGLFQLSFTTINGLSFVPMRMVACYILMLPLFILFIIFHDKMMGKLQLGGIKE